MSCCDESQKKLCGLGANYRPSHCELNAAPQVPNVSAHTQFGGSAASEPRTEESVATRLKDETPAVAAPKGRDKAKYNAYMREYMAKRRAAAKNKKIDAA